VLFWGAFFAFAFGLITYIITKKGERFISHRDSLVKIERLLWKHLQDFGALQQITNDAIISVTATPPRIPVSQLFKIQTPNDIDLNLASIEIVNKLFSYRVSVEKLDFNISTLNHSLGLIEDLYISGQIPSSQNFSFAGGLLKKFAIDFPKIVDQNKKLLIYIRIHLNRIKNRNTLIYGLSSYGDQKITEEDYKKEKRLLEKDISEASQEDFSDY
jgi:hypothetical protein